jgi:hypothetical protein
MMRNKQFINFQYKDEIFTARNAKLTQGTQRLCALCVTFVPFAVKYHRLFAMKQEHLIYFSSLRLTILD